MPTDIETFLMEKLGLSETKAFAVQTYIKTLRNFVEKREKGIKHINYRSSGTPSDELWEDSIDRHLEAISLRIEKICFINRENKLIFIVGENELEVPNDN